MSVQKGEIDMRLSATTILVLIWVSAGTIAARAEQPSCKLCADQRAACMKNYAGPACKTEYQMCMKSCKK
jgi:hypothetical protein